jgi:hypothetical protein
LIGGYEAWMREYKGLLIKFSRKIATQPKKQIDSLHKKDAQVINGV